MRHRAAVLVGLFGVVGFACSSGGAGSLSTADAGIPREEPASSGAGESDPLPEAGTSKTDAGTKDSGASKKDAGSTSDPKAPTIVSLSADGPVKDTASTTIRAKLTDPDGDGDVARGTLYDEGGTTIANFVKGAVAGSFDIVVTWSALGAISPIDFAAGAKGTRKVEAEFFDQAGHRVAKTLPLSLECGASGHAACGSTCVDLATDSHNCGACGTWCPTDSSYGAGGICRENKCSKWDTCQDLTANTTCDAICAQRGKTCQNACYGANTGSGTIVGGVTREAVACSTNSWYDHVWCADAIDSTVAKSVACCCM